MTTPITAIFFDIGGVLLSNGWTEVERRQVAAALDLDFDDFDQRHYQVIDAFDYGQISLQTYLDWAVFYTPRSFTPQDFEREAQRATTPNPETLQIARELKDSGRFFMATLNNEPRELNEYRIQHFGLPELFSAFFSSCYMGVRKPQLEAFRKPLAITQRRPAESLFIDDSSVNIQAARLVGMNAILYVSPAGLRADLEKLGLL
jgi:putative hydrolase of the HAD superfamily